MTRAISAVIFLCALMASAVMPTAVAAKYSARVVCTQQGCVDVRERVRGPVFREIDSDETARPARTRAPNVSRPKPAFLVPIQCGRNTVRVARTASVQFEGFCRDFYAVYKFGAVGGYSYRGGRCAPDRKHPCGGAIDVEQTCRSRGPGHCLPQAFPVATANMIAAKWGLKHGCTWGNKDCGHFETKGTLAGNGWPASKLAQEQKAYQVASVGDAPVQRRWPIAHSEIAIATHGDDLLAKVRPIADAAVYSIYSEVPPHSKAERPVAVLLASMGSVPVSDPKTEVARAADLFKVSPDLMRSFARIESGFNPKVKTGSYKGLFQLSDREFNKYGTGDIYAARDNAIAAANKFKTEEAMFIHAYGREPSFSDLYLIHQQGWAGADKHVSHPDDIAWRNMCKTEEGKSKGVRWCKKAIWGNVPATFKRLVKGGVEALTSNQFVTFWRNRVDRLAAGISDYAAAKKQTYAYKKAKKKRYAYSKKKRHRLRYAAVP